MHDGVDNVVCTQPFACLPNHIIGKGVIKEIKRHNPLANIVAVDYDPGASEVNQLNRIKLMLEVARKNLEIQTKEPKYSNVTRVPIGRNRKCEHIKIKNAVLNNQCGSLFCR